MDKFRVLQEAVESFIIADATCSAEDRKEAYINMIQVAELEGYV